MIPASSFKEKKKFVEAREFRIESGAYDTLLSAIPDDDRLALKGQAKHLLYPRGSIWLNLPPKESETEVAAPRVRQPVEEVREPENEDVASGRQQLTHHTPPDLKVYSATTRPLAGDASTRYMLPEPRQVRNPSPPDTWS